MPDQSLALTVWVKRGIMLVCREALDVDDPESWPSKWVEKFGSTRGFNWRKIYGKYAPRARQEFLNKTHLRNGHCPHCGEEL